MPVGPLDILKKVLGMHAQVVTSIDVGQINRPLYLCHRAPFLDQKLLISSSFFATTKYD